MVQLRNTFNVHPSEKPFFCKFSVYLTIRGLFTALWGAHVYLKVVSEGQDHFSFSLLALIVIGIVLIVFAIFAGGFNILYFDNAEFRSLCTCCISCTTVMLALLFLAMLIVQSFAGSYMLVLISRMTAAVRTFEGAFMNYQYRMEDMEFVDHIQKTSNCCGIDSYHDYRNILDIPIPDSCCYEWKGPCPTYMVARDGCKYKLGLVPRYEQHTYSIRAISIVALILVVLELIGFIFALRLVNSRRKRNARMQYAASSGNNSNKIFSVSGEIYKRSM